MILENVKDLFDKFKSYPSEIVYNNKIECIEDTIYFRNGSEMEQFIGKYGNRELLDFWIFKDKLYIEFGKDIKM